jgi:hypothetical protein
VLYWPLEVVDVTGVAPVAGTVIPKIAAVVIRVLLVVMEFEADELDEVRVPLVAVMVNV